MNKVIFKALLPTQTNNKPEHLELGLIPLSTELSVKLEMNRIEKYYTVISRQLSYVLPKRQKFKLK